MDYVRYIELGILVFILASSFAINSKLAALSEDLRRLVERSGPPPR